MNPSTKKAAVTKYGKLHAAGATAEDVKKAIAEDAKAFKAEEVEEIYEAITSVPEPAAETCLPPVVDNDDPAAIKKFGKFKAKAVFKFRDNEDTGVKERYLHSVERETEKPISIHHMEQRHADELNSQVENSMQYYFPL